MYARVVRFTDASAERIDALVARVAENDGPPEGVKATGMKLLFDEGQGTAVFVGFFETEQDTHDSAAVLEAMDTGDTPGSRSSVDNCEVKIERDA